MKNLIGLFILAALSFAIGGAEFGILAGVGLSLVAEVQPTGVFMMSIPAADVRNVFTKTLIATYRQEISVMSFLRSFFPAVESKSKEVSIQVQLGKELVAVDVERGTNGNRNKMVKSTEKIILPPYYYEYMTTNEHRLYDVAIGTQDVGVMNTLVSELASEMMEMQKKIERRYELQCAQVLETGIVTLNNGTNIDYSRAAASLVDVSGTNPWATGGNDPITDFVNACKFLREIGKAPGGRFLAICGEDAILDLLNNSTFQAKADIKNFDMDQVRKPAMSNGASYHGTITAGSYTVDLWTYPEVYETESAAGVITQVNYINAKKVIVMPHAPNFKLAFAAVPNLIGQPAQQGAYLAGDYVDNRKTAHEAWIKSAGVAVPVAVNQVYTMQVVA